MLISTFLLCDPASTVVTPSGSEYPGIVRSFELNENNLHTIPTLLNIIFGWHSASFCLTLHLSGKSVEGKVPRLDAICDACLTASFHYRYLSSRFLVPLVIIKGAPESVSVGILYLKKRFQAQGYMDVDFYIIDEDQLFVGGPHGKKFYLLPSGDDLASHYSTMLKEDVRAGDVLFVRMGPTADTDRVSGQLSEAETAFEKEMPRVFHLMQENGELADSRDKIAFTNNLLAERIESELNYRSFYSTPDSGYKKKITEITDFYKNEYEILPLWYKRFGHIIKVLAGKRTLQSLFNDNVKKYKR